MSRVEICKTRKRCQTNTLAIQFRWFMLEKSRRALPKQKMHRALPVVQRDVYQQVKREALALCGYHTSAPCLPIFKPFLALAPGSDPVHTPMARATDYASLILLPNMKSYLVTSKGALLQAFHSPLLQTRFCGSDGAHGNACALWRSGSIFGVEFLSDKSWYAVDAYVIAGKSLLNQSFQTRVSELAKVKQSCAPLLPLLGDMPPDLQKGSRLWDADRNGVQ